MSWTEKTFFMILIIYCLGAAVVVGAVCATTVKASTQMYRVTHYDEEFRGQPMYCEGSAYNPDDATTVAASHTEFLCGDRLTVCGKACQSVVVKDRCGVCAPGHIDLSTAAWHNIGEVDYASVNVQTGTHELDTIKLPSTGNGGYLP